MATVDPFRDLDFLPMLRRYMVGGLWRFVCEAVMLWGASPHVHSIVLSILVFLTIGLEMIGFCLVAIFQLLLALGKLALESETSSASADEVYRARINFYTRSRP